MSKADIKIKMRCHSSLGLFPKRDTKKDRKEQDL